ncbi:ATP-binding protein [Candidatus Saccharibacteria bacterium]|jgi:predicted kinase|nr:ATP-binding protein [Candidatus Saccharibacteria bacterium]
MNSKQPLIIKLLGVPGSGKTYFSQHLAPKINAVHLNSDAMRLAIFKSTEETTRIYNSDDRSTLNSYVHGALEYVAEQVLSNRTSVIYDANNNSRVERGSIDTIALRHNALSVTVWIQTPHDVALKRGHERPETDDQRQLSKEVMTRAIEDQLNRIEAPTDDENAIILSGETPVEDQIMLFLSKIEEF